MLRDGVPRSLVLVSQASSSVPLSLSCCTGRPLLCSQHFIESLLLKKKELGGEQKGIGVQVSCSGNGGGLPDPAVPRGAPRPWDQKGSALLRAVCCLPNEFSSPPTQCVKCLSFPPPCLHVCLCSVLPAPGVVFLPSPCPPPLIYLCLLACVSIGTSLACGHGARGGGTEPVALPEPGPAPP